MSHYTMDYGKLNREAADEQAIEDTKDYLGPRAWGVLQQMIGGASISAIRTALSLAGVSGYPVHAILRRYRLADFRAWMHEGSDAVLTDDAGFPLEDTHV